SRHTRFSRDWSSDVCSSDLQTQDLFKEEYQLQLIDAYADTHNILKEYQSQLNFYKQLKKQHVQLTDKYAQSIKEIDYNAFLLDELEKANLKSGEQEELESQYEVLANVEKVGGYLEQSYAILNNEDFGVNKQLYEVKNQLQKLAQVSLKYEGLLTRLESCFLEIEDLTDELNTELQQLVVDPNQLELVNQRLQLIHQLQRKHTVLSVDELLQIQENLSNSVSGIEDLKISIDAIEKQMDALEENLNKLAKQLHDKRSDVLEKLSNEISNLIKPLGMPNAQFKIELTLVDSF